jgi:CRP-like cAMP-binding protein
MPLVSDVPENMMKIDTFSRSIVKSLLPNIEMIGKLLKLPSRADMYTQCGDKYILIKKGDFKLMSGDKIVRLFSPFDIFYLSANMPKNKIRFFCEYSSEVVVFSNEDLLAMLQGEPDTNVLWDRWLRTQQDLNILIEAHYLTAGMKPALEMRSFEPGEFIIKEEENSDEIFEMMDGHANVIVNGVNVGVVEEGDIFGELSFLTEGKRTASVIASKPCNVNLIKREDFLELIKYRPQLIYNIARSLAKRILQLNQQKST